MLFIVNPISGTKSKSSLINTLKATGHNVVCTEYAGQAEKLAREAEDDIVVAVGGDGTVNEVARGLIGTEKTLGIIPRGSGDGLALHLGLSHNTKKALKTIEAGKTNMMDAATVNDRFFFSVCGIGYSVCRFRHSAEKLTSFEENAVTLTKLAAVLCLGYSFCSLPCGFGCSAVIFVRAFVGNIEAFAANYDFGFGVSYLVYSFFRKLLYFFGKLFL